MDTVKLPQINIIPFQKHPAEYNMAMDEHLLSLPGTFLRLYGWASPTLSLGRMNQHDDVNLDYCRKKGIKIIKRRSGGKAVLHHFELTYSFVTDAEQFPMPVRESYRQITQPIANSLIVLGLNPEMKDADKLKESSSICFKEVSAYELTVGSKKIVGSAQFRRKRRFYQHGSILLNIDWTMWKNIWGIPESSMELEKRITTLKDELPALPNIKTVEHILTDEFLKFFKAEGKIFELSRDEYLKLQELEGKYTWSK